MVLQSHRLQRLTDFFEAHPVFFVGLFVFACLGPFANRALNIDDPLFAWSGEWIQKHPFNFYGSDVNWYGVQLPMHVTNQNPPATAYLLALVGSLFGWNEVVLHAAFLLIAFGAAAGIYRLAQLWCGRPLLATVLSVCTPVFLVSGTTLMSDMLMLAFWIWAVVFWQGALKTGKVSGFIIAGVLGGCALLTKFSAVALLPLLLLLGLLQKRRPGWWLLALLLPLGMLAILQVASLQLYGHSPFSLATAYASAQRTLFR